MTTSGRLTTHVLDTSHGEPGAGVELRLYRRVGASYDLLRTTVTNADGRCDLPLLEGAAMTAGCYRIVFAAGAYFRRRGTPLADPPFLDDITVDFGIADTHAHYHVPLLVSPWTYVTYRGS